MGQAESQEEGAEDLSLIERWGAMIDESGLDEDKREILRNLDQDLLSIVMKCRSVFQFVSQLETLAPDMYLGGEFDTLPSPYGIIVELLTERATATRNRVRHVVSGGGENMSGGGAE